MCAGQTFLLALAVTFDGPADGMPLARALDTLPLGDEVSTTLGIPVTAIADYPVADLRVRHRNLVSATGAVGFVGWSFP